MGILPGFGLETAMSGAQQGSSPWLPCTGDSEVLDSVVALLSQPHGLSWHSQCSLRRTSPYPTTVSRQLLNKPHFSHSQLLLQSRTSTWHPLLTFLQGLGLHPESSLSFIIQIYSLTFINFVQELRGKLLLGLPQSDFLTPQSSFLTFSVSAPQSPFQYTTPLSHQLGGRTCYVNIEHPDLEASTLHILR